MVGDRYYKEEEVVVVVVVGRDVESGYDVCTRVVVSGVSS